MKTITISDETYDCIKDLNFSTVTDFGIWKHNLIREQK